MPSELIRASGLWLAEGKNGKFMKGATSVDIPAGSKLLIFKNDRKPKGESVEPDYQIYYAEPEQPAMARAEPAKVAARG